MRLFTFSLLIFLSALSVNSQENYNLIQRSNLPFPGKTLANIWGYADDLGNEYALVGTSTGLTIVDVTNPDVPDLLFNIPGVDNFWREVRTHEGYAYVSTEGVSGGLTVIDLTQLPNAAPFQVYRGDGMINNQLSTIHTLHIDNGYCYIYGSNLGGLVILSLNDPWNPNFVGRLDCDYIHDGYVWNDTVWAGHIYDGYFSAIDVSDKANPIQLQGQQTPGNFTHNTWLTDDKQTLLTTDEVSNSYLAAYDITDLDNITELDRYQTAPGSNTIVHNTHVLNDFAVTSWYTEGVAIVDASRPINLVEIAKNDFSPFEGDGFNGCWGVYPYLPSGNIVASDIEGGLFVLTPDYKRASYLEGLITDASCEIPLDDATIRILNTDRQDVTGLNGIFRTGTAEPGIYTIEISKEGYETAIVENVELAAGIVTELEVALFSPDIVGVNGFITNNLETPIEQAQVQIESSNSSYLLISDDEGEYARCNLLEGNYQIVTGKWGFKTSCETNVNFSGVNTEINTQLEDGYFDDFQFNFQWTVSGNATAGIWTRAIPFGTSFNGVPSNPGVDAMGDCNGLAFVTGNAANTQAGADDIDDGNTRLTSPLMDLSSYANPYLTYSRWFYNGGGTGAEPNDALRVFFDNGSSVVLSVTYGPGEGMSQWLRDTIRISDFITPSSQFRVSFDAIDEDPGHIVEAGIDRFEIFDMPLKLKDVAIQNQGFHVVPNPSSSFAEVRGLNSNLTDGTIIEVFTIEGKKKSELSAFGGVAVLPDYFDAGIYFIRINNQHSNELIRWVKTK